MTAIVCVSQSWGIGRDGALLFRISAAHKRFRTLTVGKTVILGIRPEQITINTSRSTICGSKRLIAAVGIEDLIVVDTDDAVLICAKDSTQDVKKVIENLRICNRRELI